ncbi:MAG: sulfatase-like hydrolase/transferase, partial [Planctomycetes bacterium]|nr:sulfatase-like hydrolase/transferase [Planctomycetota bacterium]
KDRQEIFNRFRNAVRQADTTVGKMLHQISKRGLLENTIVVITGDHGEEFFENGYWGHHSNFTPEQVQVPFLLHGPGIKAGVETKPSSHVDFSRTLLESLGVSPKQASNYSTGEHLLNLPDERLILSASWSSMALRLENQSTLVISDYADDLPLRAFDSNGKPLPREIETLRRTAPKLEEVLATCRRFLTTDLMRHPDHP